MVPPNFVVSAIYRGGLRRTYERKEKNFIPEDSFKVDDEILNDV